MTDDEHGALRTGHADVDAVVADVDALDTLPLAEHAGVYEGAHQRLRRALDVPDLDHPSA